MFISSLSVIRGKKSNLEEIRISDEAKFRRPAARLRALSYDQGPISLPLLCQEDGWRRVIRTLIQSELLIDQHNYEDNNLTSFIRRDRRVVRGR